jgi:hypothetical protein
MLHSIVHISRHADIPPCLFGNGYRTNTHVIMHLFYHLITISWYLLQQIEKWTHRFVPTNHRESLIVGCPRCSSAAVKFSPSLAGKSSYAGEFLPLWAAFTMGWPLRRVDISGGGNDGHRCIGPSKEAHKISGRSVMGHVGPFFDIWQNLNFNQPNHVGHLFYIFFLIFLKLEFMSSYWDILAYLKIFY